MKKWALLFHALVFASCISQRPSTDYYLTHITMVDVTKGILLKDMTVVVSDSIISAVSSTNETEIPRNAKVIKCSGKFLIPGLWDMHVHLGNATRSALALFVVNGITGVRDMGTKRFDSIQGRRKQVSSGLIVGPHIISSGPILNGGKELPDFQIGVNTVNEAIRVVDSLASIGVDFIKVHGGLTKETYYAIARESAKLHIPFAGHIPRIKHNRFGYWRRSVGSRSALIGTHARNSFCP
jgi:predicted amidohydrolase